jgi:hypothetical protein
VHAHDLRVVGRGEIEVRDGDVDVREPQDAHRAGPYPHRSASREDVPLCGTRVESAQVDGV